MRHIAFRWAVLVGFVLSLTACQGQGTAAQAIQDYLQARVESNVERMIGLSCPEWEAQARIEATSFASMNATLDGMSCEDNGAEGDATLVSCKGKIVTVYNGEQREWSLSDHQYKAVLDDGEWRMCGYE